MRTLDIPKAARKAGVSTHTIRLWLRKKILPDRRLPGTRKHIILESDLFPQQPAK